MGTAAADVTTFADSGLPENTRYYYRVTATNASGDSAPSTSANGLTRLQTPESLTATFVSGDRIDLSWVDRSSAETGYLIERSPDGVTGWTQVGSTAANATSFAVPGPFVGATAYYFRIRASSTLGNTSGYSAASSLTTPAFPSRPTGLNRRGIDRRRDHPDLDRRDRRDRLPHRTER